MDLTKAQLQIYKMELFVGGSVSNICGSILLSGEKDIDFLKKLVNDLFEINDGLRIQLYEDETGIKQKIQPFVRSDIPVLEFADFEEFLSFAEKYAKEPLDIKGALCEISIIILPGKFGILPKLHHIIGDAWAISLIGNQFNSLVSGKTPVSFSFFDYAESEKKYIGSKRYERDAAFFEKKLIDFESPVYIHDSESLAFFARRKTVQLSKELTTKIKQFACERGSSCFTVWFSAMSAFFGNIKNASDFCIGTTVLNRSGNEEKNTIGSLVNTIPVFVQLDSNDTFSESLETVESTVLSALRHQKYNYQFALESINKKGYKSQKPFDLIFSYQNTKIAGDFEKSMWHHNGMQAESLQIHIEDRDDNGAFKIHYDYQTEKFTESDIKIFHEHFCNLISDALENLDKKICELKMISDDERQKLLYTFNDTFHKYDCDDNSTLFSLFEKTAKENRDKLCIKTAEKTVTFGELLNISENLDVKIREITKEKKSVVAIIAERSVEMYSAIYGIIRGGNAYLPIDPDYPQERIDYILENSGVSAVVCQGKYISKVKNIPCIDMTEQLEFSSDNQKNVPESCAASEDTAYVIYTSGSTGNPKGAKVSHKSSVNRILWMHDKYPLGKDDVILQKTPYTFDVSVWEHFWWGMCGGSLAVSKPGEHFLPARILEEVYKNKVTHLHFVPSVFGLFLNYLEAHQDEIYKFTSVKYVFLSGEALTANLVKRFYKLYDYGKVTLHNLYGPTECAVDVTYYDCSPADDDPIPIGKPIYNTQMYVVNRHMNLVPAGVTGELCIAGMNVGQGYLNNPDLTNDKFIDNPFGEGKLYKTGDLAYWRNDGQIVFCGRKDGQIKLNGQRIEIGEIESVINSLPEVESVAVVVNRSGSKEMLIAFYSGKAGAEELIKEAARRKLPGYMVPSIVVYLEKLPLNPSGKLDRKKLAEIKTDIMQTEKIELPVDDIEKFVCSAFSDALGVSDVGRNSDFFELGGTSLSMISLISEDGFTDVSAAEFIKNPTPADLARLIKNKNKPDLEILEELYVPDKVSKSLILIPFAGGGAESFARLVSWLKKSIPETAIYFVPYLHSTDECKKVAEEITAVLNDTDIYLYSHCVGSAVAIQILGHLEKEGLRIKQYFAGASILPGRPSGKNIWRVVPDGVIRAILSKAGAALDGLSKEKKKDLLQQFRKDTDFANISYAELRGKIKTPVCVVLSKKDIFTKNYKQAENLWKKYAYNVNEICFIDSESHYFQNDNAEELIRIMLSDI